MSDQVTAFIRVLCTQIIGALSVWALRTFAIEIDTTAALAFILPIVTAAVYALVHWLEKNVDRRFGYLLGIAKPPRYSGSGLK